MDTFHQHVLAIVRSIPRGMVVSYGQVAVYAGEPKATREAGWAIRDLGDEQDFPWWRVLNNTGRVSLQENPNVTSELQQQLLQAEGVEFTEPLMLDIERYRYRPDRTTLERFNVKPEDIEEVLQKYTVQQPPLL
jgi:methylated-DNA-protein-cysteine methyltransferase-like protein